MLEAGYLTLSSANYEVFCKTSLNNSYFVSLKNEKKASKTLLN